MSDKKQHKTMTILIVLVLIVVSLNLLGTLNLISMMKGGSMVKEADAPSAPTAAAPSGGQEAPSEPTRVEVAEEGEPFKGEADAPITIVEFSDFECPFCARWYSQTLPSLEKYIEDGTVKLVFRDFPLSFHPNAQKAHEAGECANDQGKFWEMHDIIFENQRAIGVDNLKEYAANLGLDTEAFNTCLDSGEKAAEVQEDFRDGQAAGVTGTPSFFINGIKVVGAQPTQVFEQIIQQELN